MPAFAEIRNLKNVGWAHHKDCEREIVPSDYASRFLIIDTKRHIVTDIKVSANFSKERDPRAQPISFYG